MSNSCHNSVNQLATPGERWEALRVRASSENHQRHHQLRSSQRHEGGIIGAPVGRPEDDLSCRSALDVPPLCSNGKTAAVPAKDGRVSEAPW